MAEITEEQKREIIKLHEWVKAHPEFQKIMDEQVPARLLLLRSRFSTFNLPHATLLKIAEYGNEEFLMGYYIASIPHEIVR